MTSSSPQAAGRCPACGSPLAAPAATFQRCPFCHTALGEVTPLAPSPRGPLDASRDPGVRSRVPLFAKILGAFSLVVGAGVTVALLVSSHRQRSEVPVADLSTAPLDGGPEDIASVDAKSSSVAGQEAPTDLAPLAPAPSPVAPALADEPVTITWLGRIVSSGGKAPSAGASCTLSVTATAANGDAFEDQTTLECGGKTLYDSKVQTMGMYNSNFDLMEAAIAGHAFMFRYELRAQSVGMREAPASQIVVDTPKLSVDAFREGADAFRVHVAVDAESAIHTGKPVLPSNVPAFDEVVTRTARVIHTSGSVPFSARTCELNISPAKATGMNCRVQLDCGGRLVYGAGSSGYNECAVEGRNVRSFSDPVPSAKDGDPAFSCDVGAGTATLSDGPAKGALYSVSFELR
jgi:hypothetical protein